MADLKLPPSMGCIVRTAGLQRTKVEIKRDFDYLARLWDGIRETTLKSAAPALVYGDSDLIKRAIRDIYNKEIDEVIVEGDEGYRQAKEFMKLLMPSHARRVKHYSDPVPLFQRSHVEDQLGAMYHPVVQLKSCGYLVINPTEALVSIDINSGRSTREHNIEQTATATNLEAAQEIARQLRLRDMAGLVVIDFIDMDNPSNNRKVEKAMKEALKNDRARIQVGRISSFGLMEMSRQRLRTGVLEASTRPCPHCEGSGFVRTASSAGLSALRMIEDEAARGRGSQLLLRASQEAAFYLLNRKRAELAEIEERYGVMIEVAADGEQEGARMSVEASGPPPAYSPRFEQAITEVDEDEEIEEIEEEEAEEDREEEAREDAARPGETEGEREARRNKRRRRRGRRGRGRPEGEGGERGDENADRVARADNADGDDVGDEAGDGDAAEGASDSEAPRTLDENGEPRRRRGRRGRRGGRRGEGRPESDRTEAVNDAAAVEPFAGDDAVVAVEAVEAAVVDAVEESEAPKRPRRRPRAKAPALPDAPAPVAAEAATETPSDAPVEAEAPAKPKRARRAKAEPVDAIAAEVAPEPAAEEVPAKPKRRAAAKGAAKGKAKTKDAVAADEAALATDSADAAPTAPAPEPEPVTAEAAPATTGADTAADDTTTESGPPRRGWWQRTFGA